MSIYNSKKTKILREFGAKIRNQRHQLNLTQEELAEEADLHTNYVGSVERGERNITLETIVKLSKALKCSVKDLISD